MKWRRPVTVNDRVIVKAVATVSHIGFDRWGKEVLTVTFDGSAYANVPRKSARRPLTRLYSRW